jgi:Flp pilus assembly protein TadG
MLCRLNRQRHVRRGAATVELAVLLPFLAFLFVIGIDWARIFYTSMILENACRNAAYYASEYPGATDKMVYGYQDTGDAAADDMELNTTLGSSQSTIDSTLTVYYGPTSSSSYGTQYTSGAVPDSTDSYGTKVKIITVTYPFSMVSQFPIDVVGVPTSVTLSRTCTMRTAPVLPN